MPGLQNSIPRSGIEGPVRCRKTGTAAGLGCNEGRPFDGLRCSGIGGVEVRQETRVAAPTTRPHPTSHAMSEFYGPLAAPRHRATLRSAHKFASHDRNADGTLVVCAERRSGVARARVRAGCSDLTHRPRIRSRSGSMSRQPQGLLCAFSESRRRSICHCFWSEFGRDEELGLKR